MSVKRCGKCNESNNPSFSVCWKCGNAFSDVTPVHRVSSKTPIQSKKEDLFNILLALTILPIFTAVMKFSAAENIPADQLFGAGFAAVVTFILCMIIYKRNSLICAWLIFFDKFFGVFITAVNMYSHREFSGQNIPLAMIAWGFTIRVLYDVIFIRKHSEETKK